MSDPTKEDQLLSDFKSIFSSDNADNVAIEQQPQTEQDPLIDRFDSYLQDYDTESKSWLELFTPGASSTYQSMISGAQYGVADALKKIPGLELTALDAYDKSEKRGDKAMIANKGLSNSDMESWPYMIGGASVSIGASAAGMTLSAMGLPQLGAPIAQAGFGAMTLSSYGGALKEYDEYKRAKNEPINSTERYAVAIANAGIEYASERFGVAGDFIKGAAKAGKPIIKAGVKESVDTGLEMIKKYAKANPSIYSKISKTIAKGAGSEGFSEAAAELSQGAITNWYKDVEDRQDFKQLFTGALKVGAIGGMMGAGLGPLSYKAQQLQDKKRREDQGVVRLAQLGNDSVEIINSKEGKTTVMLPDGNIKDVEDSQLGESVDLKPDQFYNILKGKTDENFAIEQSRIDSDKQRRDNIIKQVDQDFGQFAEPDDQGNQIVTSAQYRETNVFVVGQSDTNPNSVYIVDSKAGGSTPQLIEKVALNDIEQTPLDEIKLGLLGNLANIPDEAGQVPQVGEVIDFSELGQGKIISYDPRTGEASVEFGDAESKNQNVQQITRNEIEQYRSVQEEVLPEVISDQAKEQSDSYDEEGNPVEVTNITDQTNNAPIEEIKFELENEDIPAIKGDNGYEVQKDGLTKSKADKIAKELNEAYPNAEAVVIDRTPPGVNSKADFRVVINEKGNDNKNSQEPNEADSKTVVEKDNLQLLGSESQQETEGGDSNGLLGKQDATKETPNTPNVNEGLKQSKTSERTIKSGNQNKEIDDSIQRESTNGNEQGDSARVSQGKPRANNNDSDRKPTRQGNNRGVSENVERDKPNMDSRKEEDGVLSDTADEKNQKNDSSKSDKRDNESSLPRGRDTISGQNEDGSSNETNLNETPQDNVQQGESTVSDTTGSDGKQPTRTKKNQGGRVDAKTESKSKKPNRKTRSYNELTKGEQGSVDAIISDYIEVRDQRPDLSPTEKAIVDMGGVRTNRNSFIRNGDKNLITDGLAKSYFRKDAQSLDVIAQEINETLFDGVDRVTPQDLVDFIVKFPNGIDQVGNIARDLAEEYTAITGKRLTIRSAKSIASKYGVKESEVKDMANDKDFLDFAELTFKEDGEVNWGSLVDKIQSDPEFFTIFPGGFSNEELTNLKTYAEGQRTEKPTDSGSSTSQNEGTQEPRFKRNLQGLFDEEFGGERQPTKKDQLKAQVKVAAKRLKELRDLPKISQSNLVTEEITFLTKEILRLNKKVDKALNRDQATKGGEQQALFKRAIDDSVKLIPHLKGADHTNATSRYLRPFVAENKTKIEKEVDKLLKKYKAIDRKDVVVWESILDFQMSYPDQHIANPYSVSGVAFDGKIHLIASHSKFTNGKILDTLLHEGVGHYGLRRMFGINMPSDKIKSMSDQDYKDYTNRRNEFNDFLDSVFIKYNEDPRFLSIAKRYYQGSYNNLIKSQVPSSVTNQSDFNDWIKDNQADIDKQFLESLDKHQQREITEEIIAHEVENDVDDLKDKTLIERLVEALRKAWSDFTGTDLDMTDDDIRRIINASKKTLRTGDSYIPKIDINPMKGISDVEIDPARFKRNDGEAFTSARFQKAPPTSSPAFKKWFGQSKVVDENGEPLVVYHGTEAGGFTEFDEYKIGENTGNATHGFYFTESLLGASTYSGSKDEVIPLKAEDIFENPSLIDNLSVEEVNGAYIVKEGKYTVFSESDKASKDEVIEYFDEELASSRAGVYPVYLSMQDPLIYDFEGRDWTGAKEGEFDDDSMSMIDLEDMAKNQGYDGVIAKNVADEGRYGSGYNWGENTYITFQPTQIKSATGNNGNFDEGNPDIRFQVAPPIESKPFKNWFGKSILKERDGTPIEYFHQTSKENVPSIEQDGFDLSIKKARESDSGMPDGIFLKSNADDIGVGGQGEDMAQIPLYVRLENPLRVDNRSDLEQIYRSKDKEYARLRDEEKAIDKKWNATFEKEWQKAKDLVTNKEFDRNDVELEKILVDWKKEIRDKSTEARVRLTELMQEGGYDGLMMKEDEGSFGRKVETVVVFEPNQVKSTKSQGFDRGVNGIRFQRDYGRVMPRDLFNESKLMAMHSRVADFYNQGKLPEGFEIYIDGQDIGAGLSDDGEMYAGNIQVYYNDEPVNITMTYNAGKNNRFPLMATMEENDIWSVTVFNDQGELDSEFIEAFGEPSGETHDSEVASMFSDQINFTKQLGVVGLWEVDGMLPRNFKFDTIEFENESGFNIQEGDLGIEALNVEASYKDEPVTFYLPYDKDELYFDYNGETAPVIEGGRSMSQEFADALGIEEDIRFQRPSYLEENPSDNFYSNSLQAVANISQNKATPDQWRSMLLNNGASQSELDWIGFEDFLRDNPKPTKGEVYNFIESNKIEVMEVVKEEKGLTDEERERAEQEIKYEALKVYATENRLYHDDRGADGYNYLIDESSNETIAEGFIDDLDNELSLNYDYDELDNAFEGEENTKYSQYTLPGGDNYKELLLTMPVPSRSEIAQKMFGKPIRDLENYEATQARFEEESLTYKSSHWDEPNILSHIRFNERNVNGERVLFLEELQSDWAQEGRKKGFARELYVVEKVKNLYKLKNTETGELSGNFASSYFAEKEAEFKNEKSGITPMPFPQTSQWVNLSLRRMIRYGAENGFDRVAWVTGEQSAERYDLSKSIDEIIYQPNPNIDGMYELRAIKDDSNVFENSVPESELESTVGKELAQKIINGEGNKTGKGFGKEKKLSGLDLKVGGEGMKSFYDKILPTQAKKLLKKLDKTAKVEGMEINTGKSTQLSNVGDVLSVLNGGKQGVQVYDENRVELEYLTSATEFLENYTQDDELISDYTFALIEEEGKNQQLSLPITPKIRQTAIKEGMPMFQRVDTVQEPVGQFTKKHDKWIATWQDRMIYLKRLQQLKYSDKQIADELNVYDKENLSKGIIMEQIRVFKEDMWTPLDNILSDISKEGISVDQSSRYLKAKHIVEDDLFAYKWTFKDGKFNVSIEKEPMKTGLSHDEASELLKSNFQSVEKQIEREQKRNKKKKTFKGEYLGGGISLDEAKGLVSEFESKSKNKKRLQDQIRKVNQFIIDKRLESGLISHGAHDSLKDQYKFYVPLRGFDEAESDPTVFTQEYIRKGRTSESGDPIGYLGAMAQTAIQRGEQNKVLQSLYRFVVENPDSKLYELKTAFYLTDKETGALSDVVHSRPSKDQFEQYNVSMTDPSITDKDDHDLYRQKTAFERENITVKIDGKTITIQFIGEDGAKVADSIKGQSLDKFPKLLSTIGQYTATLRQLYTQYSPEFAIRNMIRDTFTGIINMRTDWGTKTGLETAGRIPSSMNTVRKWVFSGQYDNSTKAGRYLREYVENGAITGYSDLKTVSEIKKEMEISVKKAQNELNTLDRAKGLTKGAINNILNPIDDVNRMFENTTRFAAFQTMREKGMSPQQAAIYAKDLTVNFNRKGNLSDFVGNFFLFFNASVQGVDRMIRPFTSGSKRQKQRATAQALVMLPAIHVMLSLLNKSWWGEDEDGKTYYDKLPDYIKTHNLTIPNFASDKPGTFLHIPLPYGFNVMFTWPEQVMAMAGGKSSAVAGTMKMASQVMESFSPLGSPNFEGLNTGESMMQYFAPTIAKPVVDVAINKNFMGSPIYREPYPGQVAEPNHQMHFQSVNPMLKYMTDTMNVLTGGDEVSPGAIDWNPEVVEHFITSYTGGVGKFLSNIASSGMSLKQGKNPISYEDDRIRKAPFFRNYTSQIPEFYNQYKFFELSDNVKTKKALFDRYVKSGDRVATKNYRESNKNYLRMNAITKDYERSLKELRNRKKALETLGRVEEANKVDDQMNTLYKDYINKYNQRIERKGFDFKTFLLGD